MDIPTEVNWDKIKEIPIKGIEGESKMGELNLYQKIVEVRKVAGGFSKDTKGYGFEYVSGNQVLSKIKDKMNELNLLLIPSTEVGEHLIHTYTTSKGKEATDFVVKGSMEYTWINGDNPEERLDVSWAYYGQQSDISQAYGSALTYSERYFLLKCLGLPTDEDDPDGRNVTNYTTTQTTTKKPPSKDRPASEKQKKLAKDIADKLGLSAEQRMSIAKKASGINVPKTAAHYSAYIEELKKIK